MEFNTLEKKNHMIILINAEKALKETQYLFMIKTFNKLEIERNHPNLVKGTCEKSTASIICNDESLYIFLYDCQGKDFCSHHFYSTLYWRSSQCNKARKGNEKNSYWKRNNKTFYSQMI